MYNTWGKAKVALMDPVPPFTVQICVVHYVLCEDEYTRLQEIDLAWTPAALFDIKIHSNRLLLGIFLTAHFIYFIKTNRLSNCGLISLNSEHHEE